MVFLSEGHRQAQEKLLQEPVQAVPEIQPGLPDPIPDVENRGNALDSGRIELLRRRLEVGHHETLRGQYLEVEELGLPGVRPRERGRRHVGLDEARDALREAVGQVLTVPLHLLPCFERSLHGHLPKRLKQTAIDQKTDDVLYAETDGSDQRPRALAPTERTANSTAPMMSSVLKRRSRSARA